MIGVTLLFALLMLVVACADQSCGRQQMEDAVCNLCTQREGHIETEKHVAFYAYLSKSLPISSMTNLGTFVYDNVETNIGNAYNRSTGTFTAPSGGVYVFHVTTVSFDNTWCTVQLMLNGVVKDVGFADSGDHGDRASASTLTILSLNKGDIVYVRSNYKGGRYLESNERSRISFSGFKLY